MPVELPEYRSALTDALGHAIPQTGTLRVWLDDDTVDRCAPDGWVHLVTAREACLLLLTGRVVELSLDNDLDGDVRNGRGHQVVDFIVEQAGLNERDLWPPDGITLHTANSTERDAMERTITTQASKRWHVLKSYRPGAKPHFDFRT